MINETQFYVFWDAENISYTNVDQIFSEILKYGIISGKRAYADWSNKAYKNWKPILDKYGIRPYQQFHYDQDETDKAIIMDIMEVVYSNTNINGICIIANDHIYGSIARRVRERGLYALGLGNENAHNKFVDACNSFININILETERIEKPKKDTVVDVEGKDEIIKIFKKAIKEIDEDIINLATLGNMLKKQNPAFDPRSYGFKKLIDLAKSLDKYIIVKTDEKKPPTHYIEVIKET